MAERLARQNGIPWLSCKSKVHRWSSLFEGRVRPADAGGFPVSGHAVQRRSCGEVHRRDRSPRGYQASTRFSEEHSYRGEVFVADLLAICDHVGLDTFAVLGYSLTAAMAAWLARSSPRVEAVVAGGFPLLGEPERVLRGAERHVDALLADDDAAAAIETDFDVRAALSFYRELAGLSDGALVTDIGCPMFALWGTADDILWSFKC